MALPWNLSFSEVGSPGLLSSISGIDGKTAANTLVYTNNSGKTAYIIQAVIYPSISNSITIGPSIGFGKSAGTNDVFPIANILLLTDATKLFGFSLVGMATSVPNGGSLYLNLTTPATGTSQSISADIIGYLR